MKSDIYNALAAINRGFDVTLESLVILQQEGVVTADYVQQQKEITEEFRAGINQVILNIKLEALERDDRDHFGKMRVDNEARLKSS